MCSPGGELPALALVDCVSRLVPGVLSEEGCFTEESHYAACWNTRSIPVPRSGRAGRSPTCSSPATISTSPGGAASSPCCAPAAIGQTCWKRRNLPRKIGRFYNKPLTSEPADGGGFPVIFVSISSKCGVFKARLRFSLQKLLTVSVISDKPRTGASRKIGQRTKIAVFPDFCGQKRLTGHTFVV